MDNDLEASEFANLAKVANLESISLGGNRINGFSDVKNLGFLTKLVQLDMKSCKFAENDNYRALIFGLFPSLQVIFKENSGFP